MVGLERIAARFNGFCSTGVDEDFNRGSNACDAFFTDPAYRPNGNLGPIEEPPFYAVRI